MRDGGFWSPQLELALEFTGYYSVISLPLLAKLTSISPMTVAKV